MLRAPCCLKVQSDGSIFYVSPTVKVEGDDKRKFKLAGSVADLTVRKKDEGPITARVHNQRLVETVEIHDIQRVEVDLTIGEGEALKPVILERIIVKVEGPRRWYSITDAFADFDGDRHTSTLVEVRRLVIANKGESKTWGAVIPVSEAKVVFNKVNETELTLADFPPLDEARRKVERVMWTDGKKQPRLFWERLEEGLWVFLMPNLSGDNPDLFVGGMAKFDHIGKPGSVEVIKGVELSVTTYDPGHGKAFRIMVHGNSGIGVWIDSNTGAKILADAESTGSDCDTVHFDLLGNAEDVWYPDESKFRYTTTRKFRRSAGTVSTKVGDKAGAAMPSRKAVVDASESSVGGGEGVEGGEGGEGDGNDRLPAGGSDDLSGTNGNLQSGGADGGEGGEQGEAGSQNLDQSDRSGTDDDGPAETDATSKVTAEAT